ncbi:rhomboid family intramembrane serine protease [Rhizobium sp. RU36D]|uniref:rhomboid family intramembrane serine protease n=1 Tax=Rhizobium sp. RU36D TaxID=1907415 RepID=UPI0009D873B3|nr:rhomboid family intramembrane serine protease [Rhizobium sp. RU36D]SMC67328.1 Membrane associated serine protease, rhomboid family [Rhizobium sp. RU36D]
MDQQFPDGEGDELGRSGAEGKPRAPRREPIFNLPTTILVSLALIAGIYGVESLLSPEQAESFAITFGFAPVRYAYPLGEQSLEWLWTPVTYSLLHGGPEHLIFNGLWLAAFGTPVARRIGPYRFVLFWIISAAAGAALHTVVNWGQPSLMIGASAVVSALMGAACRFAFTPYSRYMPLEVAPRLGVVESLRERTVMVFTAAWFFGNLVIALGLPIFGAFGEQIAWDAHIGGFLFGFLSFALFDPVRTRPGHAL